MVHSTLRARCCVLAVLSASWLPSATAAQSATPLPVEAALAQPSFQPFAPLALSPDGQWVAYTLKYPNRVTRSTINAWYTSTGVASTAVGTRVRITEVESGRTLVVGDDSATSWAPSWSPDGRYLAFYSDADGVVHLWVREMATGRTHRVADAVVRAHRAIQYPRWSPDSRGIVMPALPYGTTLPEARSRNESDASGESEGVDGATVSVLRADSAHPYGGQGMDRGKTTGNASLRADLVLVDVATGSVTTLASGYWPLEFRISSDGRWLAFTSEHAPVLTPRWSVPYDVVMVPLGAKPGTPRPIATDVAVTNFSEGMFWSPTSATLLYSVTDTAGHERYYAAMPGDWQPREVATTVLHQAGADPVPPGARTFWWDEGGRAFYIVRRHNIVAVSMPEGSVRSVLPVPAGFEPLALIGPQFSQSAHSEGARTLLLAFRQDSTKRMGFASLDLATRAWRVLNLADRRYGERSDFPADVARDGRIVFRSEDARHPEEVWIAAPHFSSMEQLSHVASPLETVKFGETRLIDFTTPAGDPRRATLLLPANYREGTRYPLVVYPYPITPRSDNVNVFGVTGPGVENMQLLATRGFAVLAPDVAPFDWTDEMRQLTSIILAGVDRVVALGIADSTRLGIMGQSWGGYTALAVITQTQRFAAAVMRGGYGDLVAETGILQPSGFAYGVQLQELKFGGTLWQRREVYLKNSPIYQFDHVRTPLLIIHGEGETTVPIFLADQVFVNLQRLGKEVEYARYAHENHNEALWSYANQRDYVTRMIDWFEQHLSPDTTKRGAELPTPRRGDDPAGGPGSDPR